MNATPRTFSRDDHYLPQTYLKRWAAPNGRLWVYRTLVSHDSVPLWRPHSVKGIAYYQHLYSQTAHGVESDEVEKWLAENVDQPTQAVLEKIAEEGRLTPKDWDILLRFFAASQARTPAYFLRRQRAWDDTMPSVINTGLTSFMADLEERSSIPADLRPQQTRPLEGIQMPVRVRVRDKEDCDTAIVEAELLMGRKLWFVEIRRMVEHTSKGLRQLHWTILRPPPGMLWLTSDDPVTVAHISADCRVTFNGGWLVPGSISLLPLDPKHLLFARKGPVPLKYSTASATDASFIQNCIARHSYRLVFGREKDEWVPTLRPRRVDPHAFEHERKEWRRWHSAQSEAEANLEDDSTWPTPGEQQSSSKLSDDAVK